MEVNMRKIETTRFGEIEKEDDKIITFAEGIPAFEDEHEFVLLPFAEESPYIFLQSAKTPELAFLMTTPFLFFPEYEFSLEDDVLKKLDILKQEDLLVYVLLTIPTEGIRYVTANLLAPVVINPTKCKAQQVVLERTSYKTKHRLFPEKQTPEKGVE